MGISPGMPPGGNFANTIEKSSGSFVNMGNNMRKKHEKTSSIFSWESSLDASSKNGRFSFDEFSWDLTKSQGDLNGISIKSPRGLLEKLNSDSYENPTWDMSRVRLFTNRADDKINFILQLLMRLLFEIRCRLVPHRSGLQRERG